MSLWLALIPSPQQEWRDLVNREAEDEIHEMSRLHSVATLLISLDKTKELFTGRRFRYIAGILFLLRRFLALPLYAALIQTL